ncbi:MAG: hypothetical protein LBK83_14090 [Treponema sp.]|jgi:hypothetical protein|nr:hypothetical protein [Treponema sp.]
MAFLTNETADALCTIIALGFAASEIEQNGNITFEFDVPGDRPDYVEAAAVFTDLGVPVTIQQSPSQTLMPFILGTNLPPALTQNFIDSLINTSGVVRNMMALAAGPNAPRGAYIGITFTVGAATGVPIPGDDPLVFGPSALEQYAPVYRQVTDNSVGNAYQAAVLHINAAAAAVAAGNGNNLAVAAPFNDPYVPGRLFGSCHGMIRAMAVQPAPAGPYAGVGNTQVYAELALGDNTSKVSSCLPCAMFMSSFGMPASSIHLGRGDNWKLPGDVSQLVYTTWADSILTHYARGISLFNPVVLFNRGAMNFDNYIANQICVLPPNNINQEIPEIFLEALTFESSFLDKIINTSWRTGIAGLHA